MPAIPTSDPQPDPRVANPARERSVYRYFDLADSFVQILLLDPGALPAPDLPGLNRAGYRRFVLQACMPELRGDAQAALEQLFPEDPLMVEDLLYQLCVEVNPELDIHEVRLRVESPVEREPEPQERRKARPDPRRSREKLRRRAQELEGRLAARVLGQDPAVSAVARCVRRAAAGLAPADRPLASLLFTGRTGTGKTELARSLARELYGDRGLVRIDCSEFSLGHEYSKLIGSPPGYVGHDDGGQLTEAVAQNPACVVLFDEVEKAHPRMHALLLQILEEGALTDGKGRRVRFDQALVVMTSNAGAREIQDAGRAVGFERRSELGTAQLESITHEALARSFTPELLGRLDETVVFHELDLPTAERIAAQLLTELALRMRDAGSCVAFTPAVARWVAARGFSPEFGARELRRVVQREIEPRLSDLLIEGGLGPRELVRVRVRRDELAFDVEA